MALVPNRFLFDFEFPLRYFARSPRLDGQLRDWSEGYLLPPLHELDGAEPSPLTRRPKHRAAISRRSCDPAVSQGFAPVWAGWNETGLFVACRVAGKRQALRCDPANFWRGDNLRVCTDMRDTRTIRRASKYCQQFYLLPTGGGRRRDQPIGGSARFSRAREHAPDVPPSALAVTAEVTRNGYSLEAHIPAGALHGFDPAEHPRIGFYYMLEDGDHGQQYLTVGDDLYWYVDPSTWATAVLIR